MNRYLSAAAAAASIVLFLQGCEKKNAPVAPAGTAAPSSSTASPNRASPSASPTANTSEKPAADEVTPLDQSEASADIKTTADIRRAIMDDKNMSTNAQNCKIITEKSGMVTLRGMVNSQAEKDSVDAKAKSIAGATKVINQLEIKSN